MLTGKTIGELAQLSAITENTLFPVEVSGNTFNIPYSAFSQSENYVEITYDELYLLYTGNILVPGTFYLITDFQTCYDQPNFDSFGNPITTGNFKSGSTEQLMVFATSNLTLSPQAFSLSFPEDIIKYDIRFNFTEVTNTPAKGRITERIDERNNRADYDFRAVQFIRYDAFLSEVYLDGTLSIDGFGNVVGNGTSFDTDFIVGEILGIKSSFTNFIGGFHYYEIISITDATNMVVSGSSYYNEFNTIYSRGLYGGQRSPFQCNITNPAYTGFSEYYTFNLYRNYNTYLGDNQDYDTFILSNNVFLSGIYINNTFGGNVVGNTFDDGMDNNTCGPSFQYNIITNDFDDNTIGPNFQRNFIECDMQGNSVVGNFIGNMIGDNDAYDFDFNVVGWNFRDNFITMYDNDFIDNIIGNDFIQNLIHYGFSRNTIGDYFNSNILRSTFNENEIGSSFYNNTIRTPFINNKTSYEMMSTIVNDLDGFNSFQNNTIGFGGFSSDLTLSSGSGGNPIFYSLIPTSVLIDYTDSNQYVTFLSGGTIVSQTIIV